MVNKFTETPACGRKPRVHLPVLVALLMLGAAAAYAQSESPTSLATAGQFATDVDRFVSTTDWADIPLQSWFSYINLSADKGINNPYNTSWEFGFAKKLSTLYLGLSYQGRFWKGSTGWGAITEDIQNDGFSAGPFIDVSNILTGGITGPSSSSSGVSANGADNVFSFLLGFDNGQALKLKLTEKGDGTSPFTRKEGPVLVGKGSALTGATDVQKGYYRELKETLIPSVEYGFSKPLEMGAFSLQPKVTLDLELSFNEQDLSWDNETRYADFTENSMSPTLTIDSGAAYKIGESLGIGVVEKLNYKYTDAKARDKDGNEISTSQKGEGADITAWKNVITPYIRFTQVIDPSFTVGASLDLPFSIENDTSTEYSGTFGFYDATKASAYNSFDVKQNDAFPKLRIGGQYQFKNGKLADKLALNAGVTVYLPALLYTDATTSVDSDGKVTEVKTESKWEWKNHQNDSGDEKIQELSLGATLKIGEHGALDFWTNLSLSGSKTFNDNQFWSTLFDWGGILFSLTY